MKTIIKSTIVMLLAVTCKAQSPIINIEDQNGHPIQDAYYKDVNNLLNSFEGTYLYTNGSTSLEIILKKKTMSFDGYRYMDLLIGEYKYIENGIEKINTLNNIDVNYVDQWSHHPIHVNSIRRAGSHQCQGCTPNEVRIRGGLVESSTDNWAEIIISKVTTISGQPAINIWVWWQMRTKLEGQVLPKASFPGGDYVLIKQ